MKNLDKYKKQSTTIFLKKSHESEYYPLIFKPVYKNAIWGGQLMKNIGRDLPVSQEPIGESWEIVDRPDDQSIVVNGNLRGKSLRELISEDPERIVGIGHKKDEPFPLLMKIIDAGKDLSLQIHPDEECCKYLKGAEPKTEMWYVINHSHQAKIIAGIKDPSYINQLSPSLDKSEVLKIVNSFESQKGAAFMIKAPTLHAIGAGNLIYEIQQNSNTTYRVSDWGRLGSNGKPRQLHTEEAKFCLKKGLENKKNIHKNFNPKSHQSYSKDSYLQIKEIGSCDYFLTQEITLEGNLKVSTCYNSFLCLYSLDRDIYIEHKNAEYLIARGRSCLIPAACGKINIHAPSQGKFLLCKLANNKRGNVTISA